jgi:hypothetical protein
MTIRSAASLVLAALEGNKDHELVEKNEIFTFRHWGAIETAHWVYLFAVMNRLSTQLACSRRASPALSMLCS